MYEIEIKSLLGGRENAERLEARMKTRDPQLKKLGTYRQVNHYFEGKGDFGAVGKLIADKKDREAFLDLAAKAKDFSLRTREGDGKTLLVLKASIDETASANGTARREVEVAMPLALAALDEAILKAGFSYKSKWSRERTEYRFDGTNVTIDRNAGYGYLAEFEVIEDDPLRADETKARLRRLMAELEVEELAQERLARMFAYYNAHWPEYYGTEKIFVIE